MRLTERIRLSTRVVACGLTGIAFTAALAFQVKPTGGRFDALVIPDPSTVSGVATTPVDALGEQDPLRAGWSAFRASHGQQWQVWLDRRSGAPMLVEGRGLPMIAGAGNSLPAGAPITLDTLDRLVRQFASSNRTLLMADDSELVLDRAASVPFGPDSWQVVFDRYVSGVPVLGDRYLFAISNGNLVQFGAPRWTKVTGSPFPDIDAAAARDRLQAYMGITARDTVKVLEGGALQMLPVRVGEGSGAVPGPYNGAVGAGYQSRLIWRVAVEIANEPGAWVGMVDAHDGTIVAFFDDNEYAQVKGGVFPVSNDGIAPDGIEKPAYPMPFTDIAIGASHSVTSDMGFFDCTPGGSNATTTLAGQYVKVNDTCGPISKSVTCDADLDMGVSTGTDCAVPAGSSAGDTHAARSSFYHINRIAEHGRAWLPGNTWLTQQLTDNVNLNQTCNAYWSPSAGTVNFFKSGGGCANTGEIAGVFLHEWGHGLDQNDGGDFDNPSEAYADITALMSTHVSCVGRGFYLSGNCSGYGDACLNCSGIRDQDWDKHASHTPATPQGFLTNNCGSGGGPCGKEVHCEGYVSAETLWDLATRDLPAAGLDVASSWQLADKLWYKSRNGSGGNAYTCALPNSDGCASTSWFSKIRVQDDDDGNLANGTPHAAAIFAAFNRHHIACGTAGDASNQNSSSCPAITAPALTTTAGSSSAGLSWTPVANAASYRILRNDAGCDAGSTIVATVTAPTTTYTDSGLANGFTEYYHVQAVGTNTNCDGVLSNCSNVTPQPFAGTVKLDASAYNCASTITITVTDANIGSNTTTAKIVSNAEPLGETVTLTQGGGSASYVGTIPATTGPAGADGQLSVADGNTITATYIDADDGQGGHNLTRTATAGVDCVAPVITNVQSSNITGAGARITWSTNENANSTVSYGPTSPGSTATDAALVTAHTVDLTGLAECTSYVYTVRSVDGVANAATDDNGGTYYSFETAKNAQPNYPYGGPPVPIPDNNPAGATASIVVPDSKPIVDLNVTVDNLTHTYDGDIALHIIGPDNTDVVLSGNHGGSGDNYIGTIFDDAAGTPVSSGAAPFTGTFRPDQPLSVFNGKNAAGTWKFFVVDSAGADVGNINAVTLNFTFPAAACGPHATYGSHALVSDTCSSGGAPGNGLWEAGETVNFKVNLTNDGSTTLTGVTATVVPLTAGVGMPDPTASYPSIAAGANADSNAPHFTAKLPTSLACGSTFSFRIDVTTDQGAWSSTFNQVAGLIIPSGGGTALNESFAGGIPATWTVVNGGKGGGAAATWTTANPGARSIAAPMAAPTPIIDSDAAGGGAQQNEQLITPALNLQTAATVSLAFDENFHWLTGGQDEIADVDVQSSRTSGAWVNVLHQQGASSANPAHKVIDVTAQAAGATAVQVRFHYYQGKSDGWWQVDNVQVTYVSVAGCNQTVCPALPTSVKPVPDGAFGAAMGASRNDPGGTQIGVTWDVSTCVSTGFHILYGDLATVASSTISGSACAIGTSGSYSWTGVPGGDLWFVVAADDGTATEGSWGTGTAGERGGGSASGQCGMSTRDNSGSCP